eukprot:jgi/Mesen1/1981/ME000147S01075
MGGVRSDHRRPQWWSKRWLSRISLGLLVFLISINLLSLFLGTSLLRLGTGIQHKGTSSSENTLSLMQHRWGNATSIKLAILSVYPPQLNGIGEWTYDLIHSGFKHVCSERDWCPLEVEVIALDMELRYPKYPVEVRMRVRRGCLTDYYDAADYINTHFDVLNIQHEFGWFAGPKKDDYLFKFWDRIKIPVSVNFHTVMGWKADYLDVEVRTHSLEVLRRADHVTHFMPQLCDFHHTLDPGVPCSHVPHGYKPGVPHVATFRRQLGKRFEKRRLIVSLGFIGPDKGFHFMIKAMGAVARHHPSALYVIVGGYAPGYDGSYFKSLQEEVLRTNLSDHVYLVTGTNLAKQEVFQWIALATVVVAPHTWRHQVSSGTLAMGMGLGKAVVTSAFPFAEDYMCARDVPIVDEAILTTGRGGSTSRAPRKTRAQQHEKEDGTSARPCWTVPFMEDGSVSVEGLATTVSVLLSDSQLLRQSERLALARVQGASWEDIAVRYTKIYSRLLQQEGGAATEGERESLSISGWDAADLKQAALASAWTALSPELRSRKWRGPPSWHRRFVPLSVHAVAAAAVDVHGPVGPPAAIALLTERFSHGPLLFSRWIPAAAAPKDTSPESKWVDLYEFGQFYATNGLLTLYGNLARGRIVHAVLEEGLLFGYGVVCQFGITYSFEDSFYRAYIDKPEGGTWGSNDLAVWISVPLKGSGDSVIGFYCVTLSFTPHSLALTAEHLVTAAQGVKLERVEVTSKVHYDDELPRHRHFYAFRGGTKVSSHAPLLLSTDLIYDSSRDESFTWDVVTNRHGDHGLFTVLPNASAILRYITYEARQESADFLHIDHRYVLQVPFQSSIRFTETKYMMSKIQVMSLEAYGQVFANDTEYAGFDLSSPKDVYPILDIVTMYAKGTEDKHHRRVLNDWLAAHEFLPDRGIDLGHHTCMTSQVNDPASI